MSSTATAIEQRPKLRGALHAVTAICALPAGGVLIYLADGTAEVVGSAVYSVSVVATFATSASYHRLTQSVKSQTFMQRLDHAMIFALIAGTYTPICLLAMPMAWGVSLLASIWLVATVGFVMKLVSFDRYRILNVGLYPILGWVAVVASPVLYRHMSGTELSLLIAGGVLYTVGIPVLELERPDPWPLTFGYHEIWHVFTVVAAICHFALVVLLITNR
jgi:hemolysin III